MAERNAIQRRLRRAKDAERRVGRFLIQHDGEDPRFRPGGGVVTSTGRVGHVTEMQIDVLSKTYAAEVKNIQVWAGLWGFWIKIVQRAWENGKEPMMAILPTNEKPTHILGRRIPNLHILTEDRHAELLDYEQAAKAIEPPPADLRLLDKVGEGARPVRSSGAYSKQDQLAHSPKKGRSK